MNFILKDFSFDELEHFVVDNGFPKYRAQQIYSWLYKHGAANSKMMHNLSDDLKLFFRSKLYIWNFVFIQSINRTSSTYVTVGVFVDIGAVIMLFYTGMLFFQKRKSFPKWFIAFHSLYFLWICLRIVWMFELSIEAVYKHVVELVRQTSTVVVWIPYMLRSKRVRNTFVYWVCALKTWQPSIFDYICFLSCWL